MRGSAHSLQWLSCTAALAHAAQHAQDAALGHWRTDACSNMQMLLQSSTGTMDMQDCTAQQPGGHKPSTFEAGTSAHTYLHCTACLNRKEMHVKDGLHRLARVTDSQTHKTHIFKT